MQAALAKAKSNRNSSKLGSDPWKRKLFQRGFQNWVYCFTCIRIRIKVVNGCNPRERARGRMGRVGEV